MSTIKIQPVVEIATDGDRHCDSRLCRHHGEVEGTDFADCRLFNVILGGDVCCSERCDQCLAAKVVQDGEVTA